VSRASTCTKGSKIASSFSAGIPHPVSATAKTTWSSRRRAQEHLLTLINDILHFARIEAGKLSLDVTDVEVGALLGELQAFIEPQLAVGELTLVSMIEAGLRVRADQEKAQQILINLLTNAVKFTPSGERVAVDAARDGDGRVMLRVSDTGVGIGADECERIFEPFVQARSGERRQAEGTGLGLAISRDLARAMGGDLTAESEPDAGATFTFVLPTA